MGTYLVTGTAGFIGANVAAQLLANGHTVVGVDNLNDAYDVRLKQWRLQQLQPHAGFFFVHSMPLSIWRRGLVCGSRCATRGSTWRPTPRARSKKAAEVLAYTYHYLYNIDVSVVRYFTVYGPAGRPDMSLFRFVQWISEGKPVIVFGDGQQSRDFTYVDDIARGTIAALRPLGYEILNLGSDTPVVLMDAIRLVERLVGREAHIIYHEAHPADVRATWADISKAERLLRWRPQTTFEEGVASLVRWYQENREWASQIETGV